MNLDELGLYKQRIIRLFSKNTNLINLIMPTPDDDRFEIVENFIGGTYQYEDSETIKSVKLKGYCYDVPYVYVIIDDARPMICLDTWISRIESDSVKEVSLSIQVMCPKSRIALSDTEKTLCRNRGIYGNRVDCIISEIYECIEKKSKSFGIGNIKLAPRNGVQPYYPDQDYYGKILTYTCSDFLADYAERSLNGR